MFNVTESVTIPIRGLKKERVFLQISDAHLTYAYPEDSEDEKLMAQKNEDIWNKANVKPIDAFAEFLEFAKKTHPDGVFMLGDIIDYYTKSNVRRLKEMLDGFDIDYIYLWGNHEDGSYGIPLPEQDVMVNDIAPLMHDSVDCYMEDHGEFIILGIDNSHFDISKKQFDFVNDAILTGKPIIMLMHVPISTPEFDKTAWSTLDKDGKATQSGIELAELIRNSPNIVAILAGHEHVAWSGEFAPGRFQYVSAPCFRRFVREVRLVCEG